MQNCSNSSQSILRETRRNLQIALAIFLFSAIMNLLYFSLEPYFGRDAETYLLAAQHVAETGVLNFNSNEYYSPLFVVSIGFLSRWSGLGVESVGLVLNLLASAAIPAIAFLIGIQIFRNRWTAVLAALLLLLHWRIREITVTVQRDAPGLCFLLLSIFFCISGFLSKKKPWLFGICGFFLGISIGFRYEELEFLIYFCLFLAGSCFIREGTSPEVDSWKKRLGWALHALLWLGVGTAVGILIQLPISQLTNYHWEDFVLHWWQTYIH